MICPHCQRPTSRMVYRRDGKLCADCANPNFLHDLVTPEVTEPVKEISRLADWLAQPPKPPPLETLRCVIDFNPQTLYPPRIAK